MKCIKLDTLEIKKQMTEQVIDIRDRIEKMRTQMTGSSNANHDRNKQRLDNKNSSKNNIKIEKLDSVEVVKTDKRKVSNTKIEGNLSSKKDEKTKNENFKKAYNFSNMNTNPEASQ